MLNLRAPVSTRHGHGPYLAHRQMLRALSLSKRLKAVSLSDGSASSAVNPGPLR